MVPRPAKWSQSRKFGIVIDAGSSGSRIQIYSWLEPEIARQLKISKGESLEILSKVEKGVEEGNGWFLKVEPGISQLGPNPSEVANYLKPLLSFATSVVPSTQLSSTPIFLLATAGMRLLPPAQQDAILAATCSVFNASPFAKIDCKENVRIITGEEEGLYGWVAVNYLMDGFDKHDHSKVTGASISGHGSTYGFLDMGGASTQIAFEPNEVERIKHADNLVEVKLTLLSGKEVKHPVFVTTWLGFGTNQARDRYIDGAIKNYLAKTSNGSTTKTIDDGSSSTSSSDSNSVSDASSSNHKNSKYSKTPSPVIIIEDPCLPKSLLLTAPKHESYTLKGTGDFALCVISTGPLLNKSVKCLDEPCLFNGVHVPKIDFSVNHFIGISEYWYALQDIWSMGGVYDFVTFEKNAFEYCEREWDDIIDDHKKGEKWKSTVELGRLESQCFKAAWVINILHEGIGIPRFRVDSGGAGDGKDQVEKGNKKAKEKGLIPPHFQSVNTVGEVAVSWTLGKMVLEVSKSAPDATDLSLSDSTLPSSPLDRFHAPAWSEDLKGQLSSISNTDLVPISGIILLALIGLFIYFSRKLSSSRNSTSSSRFTLLSQDADGSPSPSSSSSPSTTPSSSSRQHRRKPSSSTSPSFFTRVMNPLRWGVFVVSSTVRSSISKNRRSPLSPLAINSSNTQLPARTPYPYPPQNLSRPVAPPPRRANTSPFVRSSTAGSTTSGVGGAGREAAGGGKIYYNDAPEFISSRNIGVGSVPGNGANGGGGTLSRTQSAVQLNGAYNGNSSSLAQRQPLQVSTLSTSGSTTSISSATSTSSRPSTPSLLNPSLHSTTSTSNYTTSPTIYRSPHSATTTTLSSNTNYYSPQSQASTSPGGLEGTLTPPSSYLVSGDGAKLRSGSRSGSSSPVDH